MRSYRKSKNTDRTYHCDQVDRIRCDMQATFRHEIGAFLSQHRVDGCDDFEIKPAHPAARSLHILTGASFVSFDPAVHGHKSSHALWSGKDGNAYLLNNTAALLVRLLERNERVVVHTRNPDLAKKVLQDRYSEQVIIVGGDLRTSTSLTRIYQGILNFSKKEPISEVKLALYNSFSQSSGEPFKPMHSEPVEEVERAASGRLRFIYNMTALAYDLLLNRGQDKLRIVSFSALASKRPSYALLADATDKVICDLAWRTFHIEANAHLAKPVSIYQLNPGIIACGDVYEGNAKQVVLRESVADGHPMHSTILSRSKDLPQLSANDIALVADRLLTTPDGENPNTGLPKRVRNMLNANQGSMQALRTAVEGEIRNVGGGLHIGTNGTLPEYVLSPLTVYGKLPPLIPGAYRRVMLTPKGQSF